MAGVWSYWLSGASGYTGSVTVHPSQATTHAGELSR